MGRGSKGRLIRMARGTTAGGKGLGGDGGRAWLSRTGTGVVRAARPVRGVSPQVPRRRRGRDGHPAPHPWRRQPPSRMCRATRGPPPAAAAGRRRCTQGPHFPVAARGSAPSPPHCPAPRHLQPPAVTVRRPTHPIPRPQAVASPTVHYSQALGGGGALPARPSPTTPRRMSRPPPSSHPAQTPSVPSPILPAPSRQHQQHWGVPSPGWKPAASATAVGGRQAGAHHGDGGGGGASGGRGVRGRGRKEPAPSGAAGCMRRGRRGETERRRGEGEEPAPSAAAAGAWARRVRRRWQRQAGCRHGRPPRRRPPRAARGGSGRGGRGEGGWFPLVVPRCVWRAHGLARSTASLAELWLTDEPRDSCTSFCKYIVVVFPCQLHNVCMGQSCAQSTSTVLFHTDHPRSGSSGTRCRQSPAATRRTAPRVPRRCIPAPCVHQCGTRLGGCAAVVRSGSRDPSLLPHRPMRGARLGCPSAVVDGVRGLVSCSRASVTGGRGLVWCVWDDAD